MDSKKETKIFEFHRIRKSWKLRTDFWPFLYMIYPLWLFSLICYHIRPTEIDLTPVFSLGIGLSILVNLIFHLSTHWSVHWKSSFCFDKVKEISEATHVKVIPTKLGRTTELCPIKHQLIKDDQEIITIDFLKKRYHYKKDSGKFVPTEFPTKWPTKEFFFPNRIHGLSAANVEVQRRQYGKNVFDINLPTFMDLFKQHATAPFFVFQIFCVTLWLLDEYWTHSLMTLCLLVFLEAQLVYKRLKELGNLREMRLKPSPVFVLRDKKWVSILSDDLLPGDIFSVCRKTTSQSGDFVCPCDALLLQGTAVMNESVLTGESVPQTKVAFVLSKETEDRPLDLKAADAQSVLFAGTTVAAHYTSDETNDLIYKKVPNHGCVCMVLRTGFDTTQGKIVRTLMFASERVTGESQEALLFLIILLFCSLIASGYVLHHNWNLTGEGKRSRFKLLLNCIMIVTSVVPPEFPITMSMAVTLSLVELFKQNIFCTEPFRLPFAAKEVQITLYSIFSGRASICAFDKTGTLTSDNMKVRAVLGLPGTEKFQFDLLSSRHLELEKVTNASSEMDNSTQSPLSKSEEACSEIIQGPQINSQQLSMSTVAVMAACHSLAPVEGIVVGDPMEKAAMEAVGWSLRQMDVLVSNSPGEPDVIKVLKRFPFASELQRVTVVVHHQGPSKASILHKTSDKVLMGQDKIFTGRAGIYVLSKGSPEIIKKLLARVPDNYDETSSRINLAGYRVLAMAAKYLSQTWLGSSRLDRHDLETSLEFVGFLVIGCPIKTHTCQSIKKLIRSHHRLIMVTGDHPLTACQVSIDVGICIEKDCILLQSLNEQSRKELPASLVWKSRDGKLNFESSATIHELRALSHIYALCVTGMVLDSYQNFPQIWSSIVQCGSVFARMSPRHKELILHHLVACGETVVMCGDGTNDVGALKAANIGVSLLSSTPTTHKDSTSTTTMPKTTTLMKRNQKLSFKEKLEKMTQEEAAIQQPQLGTASIASPFTHKGDSITCVPTIIKLGRATLATVSLLSLVSYNVWFVGQVMMMYKTMAINSLITAFALSVLILDGIKFGDLQATVENFFISYLTFLTSRARPAKVLSVDRPVESIFRPYVLISIFGQSALHLATLYLGWKKACEYRGTDYVPDIDGDFKPNLVNTVIFYILAGTHGASFLANYEGRPFMLPMRKNKLLWKGLLTFFLGLFFLVLEIIPSINSWMSLELLHDAQLKKFVILLLIIDILGSWALGRICCRAGVRSENKRFQLAKESILLSQTAQKFA